MKYEANKFDRLPQDFDREAIWEGIEKPRRQPVARIYFRVALLVVAVAALFSVFTHSNSPIPKSEQSGRQKTESAGLKSYAISSAKDLGTPAVTHSPNSSVMPDRYYSTAEAPETGSRITENSGEPERESIIIEKTDSSAEAKHDRHDPLPDLRLYANRRFAYNIDLLPASLFLLKNNSGKMADFQQEKIIVKHKSRKQSLALRVDLGTHHANFVSGDDETSKWRSNLEKPQLDYGLTLRYAYLLKQNFQLSLSVQYHLYKDRITTTFARDSMGLDVQVDYKLYNHYHVFSGQVEAGKRFYLGKLFCDVDGGVGLKFNQVSEVDYFIDEDKLEDKGQINSAYQSKADMFFTAQAAIGRHLNERLFVRMGTQASSGINLTAPGAGVRHSIVPINAFLEIGMRL